MKSIYLLYLGIIIIVVESFLYISNTDLLFNWNRTNIVKTFIITPEWKEIQIEPPLEVKWQSQNILIEIPNIYETKKEQNDTYSFIDNKWIPLNIEIELINQNDKVIKLFPTSISASIGFSLLINDWGNFFDKNSKFKTIRLKSSNKNEITVWNIEWYTWTWK